MLIELLKYRWHSGSFAWIIHRLTGLALTVYLTMHIMVISTLSEPERFSAAMGILGHPVFKILEIGLLGCILFHALNGIRILIVDFGNGARYHKLLYWLMLVAVIVLTALGGVPFVMEAMHNA